MLFPFLPRTPAVSSDASGEYCSSVDDGFSCRDHVKKRGEARSDNCLIQGDESEEKGVLSLMINDDNLTIRII